MFLKKTILYNSHFKIVKAMSLLGFNFNPGPNLITSKFLINCKNALVYPLLKNALLTYLFLALN